MTGGVAVGEPEVEGLSKVFRSTKGAATVGFIGIGFKSVFGRFRQAQVSGWGWTFRYEMHVVTGERYGDVHTDPLGAVIPIWDDSIPDPEANFTTRFELSDRIDKDMDLRSDLAHLFPEDDLTLLAILAASNLRRFKVDGRVWNLGIDDVRKDGNCAASARSGDRVQQWRLFPVRFEPSPAAIRRFLEHRRIWPTEENREEIYATAARPRTVLGVLPLDDEGVPLPLRRGQVYATLPTKVTLPFGLYINADWLLNISRTGLGEVEDDPWQRDIADCIADVLLSFVSWIARTFSTPDATRAAFAALASPSQESKGLEAILAKPRWLTRLRDRLEDAEVVPVWTDGRSLSFAAPHEAIVPPAALAAVFERQPALRPAVLLRGPVLARHVLGSGGRELMDSAGLLTEMSQRDLKQLWAGGLEKWWEGLGDEELVRRDLLFHLWAAVSRLTSATAWSTTDLPCVRTADGTWRSVDQAVFFKGRLPSDGETGGIETRQFIQPFIDEAHYVAESWIQALSQGAGAERKRGEQGHLSRGWQWIEARARGIGLPELVEKAVNALDVSPAPDWSVLVPLGRWALRQNRRDMLVRVLVDSEISSRGLPVNAALLSDPYVRNQNREVLFPGTPVISAAYLEHPETANPHEWRTFFENAGAKGPLKVRAVNGRAPQGAFGTVSKFLGKEVGSSDWSNASGYTLRDFEIDPALPDPDAPEEHRQALSAWLDDGFSTLRGKGRRQAEYVYYGQKYSLQGMHPSAWLLKLSALAWVPSSGQLRFPRDVLPRTEPARDGAPVAELSTELVSVLEQEGMDFGTAIPEATALQRFLVLGSQLTAEELAVSLQEVREQVSTDEDIVRFKQAVLQLDVPSKDNERVPLVRIVRSVGGGQHRGTLGRWIAPLARFHERLREELEHSDFPCEIPETTTGDQALDYLRDVWGRARSSPEGLANEVRDVLPFAYAYVLGDCAVDPLLSDRWKAAVPDAAIFADREWVGVANAESIYFDDVDDRRFIPEVVEFRTATAGHLGNSPSDQRRAAEALGLPLLSSAVTIEWSGQDGSPVAKTGFSGSISSASFSERPAAAERVARQGRLRASS